MALKFNCSKCSQEIVVKYLKVGETAKCRSCNADVIVPAQAVPTEEPASIEIHSDIGSGAAKNSRVFSWKLSFSPVVKIISVLMVCCIVLLDGLFILGHYGQGSGEEGLFIIGVFLGLFYYLSYLMIIVSPIGLIFTKTRTIALAILVLCLVNVLTCPLVFNVGNSIRMKAFHELAKRSKPLVDAVKSYENKYGRPPETLEKLVPEFLVQVPQTGMGAYHDYKYETDPGLCYNNPWIIRVFCGGPGGIGFDEFMYFPKQNYNDFTNSPSLERVEDWAYYHE
ncbi:MAG TPA: hypothetical protein VJC37_02370 [Planctomycetota bacterium]|nr:hypothetical protein [Planctomycetota bacterium]